ncbi:MAG: HlyD family efflux transporter periplasmic adaptor subunit [Saprospiraceae bacterium]|nr:HlyD family efflux transporter periplasmic adaptor subunit [Candidatus Vicinibacter affinis]MBP6173505.1 HlyD family efflux transporter periplasmic adaptor subunit [Saprospiraceae bacterium]MBK6825165.1 HlyD family efflux transporter periplasmic adaptor subunit [Candidatus Vicinibacter affinis]MBK7303963.1 HlyD family efflux transporter periplasmic adaptor subunit [Candidatus Vicinibacter affinis]MBK7799049.1 HlyD family efflux transporter periplasmic adaptor subunit [Candidatus Vicinibacter
MNQYNIPLKSFDAIYLIHQKSRIKYYFWTLILLLVLFLFLPWTQNIKTIGNITTLSQEQRPQKVNSPIPGKISQWKIKEGDFVKKGDTIIILTEIKEDYLDPNLITRTQSQVDAKKGSITYYKGKIGTTEMQIGNLIQAKNYKIQQLDNKISQINNKLEAENAELVANENEVTLLKNQYERQLKMFDEGLVSQTQLQQRNIQYQNAVSKKIITENKIAQTKQELINIRIEKNGVEQEYAEKINKAEGDKYQNLSQIASTQADVAKLENQVSNYTIRNGMYIVTASQDGQIVQANKSGIGEILKDGETIAIIVPTRVDYAIEMFIRPMDLPLINIGQPVRFTFDGYPAIVFSGWPNGSYGTFAGRITSFENAIGPNGMYRVLVAEDSSIKKWPEQLKIGTGAHGILLLKDVSIWYELWRNVNGFPVDFYIQKKY